MTTYYYLSVENLNTVQVMQDTTMEIKAEAVSKGTQCMSIKVQQYLLDDDMKLG